MKPWPFVAYILGVLGMVVLLNIPKQQKVNAEVGEHKIVACEAIHNASIKYQVPETLMVAIVNMETPDWNENSVEEEPDGTLGYGLFKFNSAYLSWFKTMFGLGDPLDTVNAADSAAQYLVWLYNRTGSWEGATQAWNCGYTRWATKNIPYTTKRNTKVILAEARLEK
jgi:hypothetical protein